ncbi:MAG: oxaloacetate-decarboxylating malate dehydrogenase, partial [Propionibacteriaceae bacterium]|nr:oxaloacetate-decarboxylating malate dehydrogenase [Propionibacteriaceae bacterium]
SAMTTTGERLADQRIVVHGAGTAGIGIADMLADLMVGQGLSKDEAHQRFWALNSSGLILAGGERVRDFQRPYARPDAEVASWDITPGQPIALADVVRNVHPTILIGTSAQAGAFTEPIVKDMAATAKRPIILALSNPTSLCEALPSDLVAWTDGRALIATGSPFDPVVWNGGTYQIAQANNSLIFPGIGLGCCACRPTRITDSMVSATAAAVAEAVTDRGPGASLLPGVNSLRRISARVAEAFIRQADAEGNARVNLFDALAAIPENMWEPAYPRIEAVEHM